MNKHKAVGDSEEEQAVLTRRNVYLKSLGMDLLGFRFVDYIKFQIKNIIFWIPSEIGFNNYWLDCFFFFFFFFLQQNCAKFHLAEVINTVSNNYTV